MTILNKISLACLIIVVLGVVLSIFVEFTFLMAATELIIAFIGLILYVVNE